MVVEVEPAARAETAPHESTVATDEFEEAHVISASGLSVPSPKNALAEYRTEVPA